MFFSNNNSNSFAHLPSSSSYNIIPPHPSFLLSHDHSNEIFLNHHHHDLVSAASTSLLPPNSHQVMTESSLMNATMSGALNGEYFGCPAPAPAPGFGNIIPTVSVKKKSSVKKDRHSKICTAQGVRDRRVRLSIEIAREFFDLQDMLGFDKASKTLEWLLNKSKNAIKELVKIKQSAGNGNSTEGGQRSLSNSSSDQECEIMVPHDNDRAELMGTAFNSKPLKKGVLVSEEEKNMKKLHKAIAKDSRVKARARARERTREKMCSARRSTTSTITNEYRKRCSPDSSSPQFFNQLRSNFTQLDHEASKKSDHSYHAHYNMASNSSFFKVNVAAHPVEEPASLTSAAVPRENVMEKSIVIKRKFMNPSSTILGTNYHHQNLASKDVSCSSFSGNNNYLIPNLHQNWEITNVNLSTGVQIYGKP